MFKMTPGTDGFLVARPGGGPSDEEVMEMLTLSQNGSIAFQLGEIAWACLSGKKLVLETKAYEA